MSQVAIMGKFGGKNENIVKFPTKNLNSIIFYILKMSQKLSYFSVIKKHVEHYKAQVSCFRHKVKIIISLEALTLHLQGEESN